MKTKRIIWHACPFCETKFEPQDRAEHSKLHPDEYDLGCIYNRSHLSSTAARPRDIDHVRDELACAVYR